MERDRCLVVVRVRGLSGIRGDTRNTLEMLNLNRNCHCTIIDNRPSYVGMLQKAQNYITWGEPSKDIIKLLLEKRGRTIGNKPLKDDFAKEAGYNSLEELAEALHKMEIDIRKISNIKPVFRLHPPRKGFKGTVKRSFTAGGTTGYRGEAINDLIIKMI